MNFLELLVAEWYEFSGYFVRSNPRARKRKEGGWDVELDVLAYLPANKHLIHIETSSDANSWEQRKKRFLEKKFILTKEEYESLVGTKIETVEKIAIVGWSKSTNEDLNWKNDIRVMLIPDFIKKITKELKATDPLEEAVPEKFPLMRAIQISLAFSDKN